MDSLALASFGSGGLGRGYHEGSMGFKFEPVALLSWVRWTAGGPVTRSDPASERAGSPRPDLIGVGKQCLPRRGAPIRVLS
jgi:hypothetical protein